MTASKSILTISRDQPLQSTRTFILERVCQTPILQLYQGAEPELIESNAFAHESQTPEDFVKSVRSVLRRLNN